VIGMKHAMKCTFRRWLDRVLRPRTSAHRSTKAPTVHLELEPLEERRLLSTFAVTDNSDDPADTNSLRFALNHLAAGGNTIDFAIIGSTTIDVGSVTGTPLPTITQPVSIDGLSQGGGGYSGPPLVVLNGARRCGL
jgi:hypothetical protein